MKYKILLVLVLLAMVLPFASVAEAQTVRYYLLPVDLQIINGRQYRGPSYFQWRFNRNPEWLVVPMDYKYYSGRGEGIMFLWAEVTTEQHDWLAAQADVFVIPENPDVNPSPAELSALEAYLEAGYTPADWLSPSDTWRTNVRTAVHMWSLVRVYTRIRGVAPYEDPEFSYNAQFRNLAQGVQDAINQAYAELGFDSSVIRSNWSVRIIMKNSADQRGNVPIPMSAHDF